ncbi:MAG: tripartite tricarboxylate transporter TctB family protein [Casimicrobiaceae bacterium]
MSVMLFPVAPRTDLRTAFFWIALGAAIVFGSWRMDRLEQQGAELYTAPGLWPGVIGLLLALLGGILAWRSVRRARAASWNAVEPEDATLVPASRFALATAMFFGYALLLVGRGLPFWLGTALFVTAFVFVFRRADRLAGDGSGTDRGDAILAVICGVATAIIVSLIFEQLFFVRLP